MHFSGALYHVISRGNRKQGIFLDEKDLEKFLAYLSDYKERYTFQLYAYALMKNHLHLLLEVKDISLSRIMQSLLYRYTRYFNWRHGEVGHLFQGRYKAILCDKDAYLLELVRYIHLNPVRAKMAKSPEDYAWTGHLSYLGRGERPLIDEDCVLEQFNDKKPLGRRGYRQFVWEGISGGHDEKYYQVKDQRYLGENSFVERVEKEEKERQSWVYELPLAAISEEISIAIGIPGDKLYSRRRDREGARGRGIVGYLARKISDYGVKEIADHFGRSPVAISEGMKKIEDLQRSDRAFAKTLNKLAENVVKGKKRKYRITEA
jgi:REP element-mobilizing transposase RayT